jgi:hypothetical protein|eukprot:COSAG01_NODE_564_length_15447_cov_14.174811_12_plen_73_part_00
MIRTEAVTEIPLRFYSFSFHLLHARQVVLGGAPLPPEVVRYSLVHIVGWDARGAELTHNRYFDGFDGTISGT